MNSSKSHWKRVPASVRKPLVMIVGSLFILAAGLTGWLPGPGGIPLFLIGIAVLATEFAWAKKVQDKVIEWVHHGGAWLRQHKLLGGCLIVVGISIAVLLSIDLYVYFR